MVCESYINKKVDKGIKDWSIIKKPSLTYAELLSVHREFTKISHVLEVTVLVLSKP